MIGTTKLVIKIMIHERISFDWEIIRMMEEDIKTSFSE